MYFFSQICILNGTFSLSLSLYLSGCLYLISSPIFICSSLSVHISIYFALSFYLSRFTWLFIEQLLTTFPCLLEKEMWGEGKHIWTGINKQASSRPGVSIFHNRFILSVAALYLLIRFKCRVGGYEIKGLASNKDN